MKSENAVKLILVSICALLINATSFAGTSSQTRSSCGTLKKYSCAAYVFNYGILVGAQQSGDCSYASAYKSASHCSAQCSNSASGFSSVPWSDRWWAKGGSAFITPSAPPTDSTGIARCEIGSISEVSAGTLPGTTVVHLSGFTGSMVAAVSTSYGSLYRVIIWKGTNPNDSELTSPSKVLYDGTARIENGQLITSGIFNSADFTVTTITDTSGAQVLKVEPVPNLSKTITLNDDNSDNTVTVSLYAETGFGTYDPMFPFSPNNIPTLSQWALIFCGVMFLLLGTFYISKIRMISL